MASPERRDAAVTVGFVVAGKNTVEVRTVMPPTDGKLSDEIRQVDPDEKF